MKFQIPIFNDLNGFGILNIGYCDLFVIWNLKFGILSPPSIQKQLEINKPLNQIIFFWDVDPIN